MSDTAVLVLGGGPAGAAAAITSAAAGLAVVLIERDEFPRHAPGESLHPGTQPLLRQLGVETEVLAAGFLRYAGHRVQWEGAERWQPFGSDAGGPWLGFQAWRPTFDALLLDHARRLGVCIKQPCATTGPLLRDGRIAGVETTTGPVRADVVVDATGRWRVLSRWLRLGWHRRGPTRLAWYGYATGPGTARLDVPTLRADARGWTWVARVRPDVCAWTRLNFDNTRPPAGWLPPELVGLSPDGPVRGADVTWQLADRPAGPGYFLTGDAAASLDPSSSHGVLKALMTGIFAAHLSAGMLRGVVPADVVTDHFSRWVHEWFDRDADTLDQQNALAPNHPPVEPSSTHLSS